MSDNLQLHLGDPGASPDQWSSTIPPERFGFSSQWKHLMQKFLQISFKNDSICLFIQVLV